MNKIMTASVFALALTLSAGSAMAAGFNGPSQAGGFKGPGLEPSTVAQALTYSETIRRLSWWDKLSAAWAMKNMSLKMPAARLP